MEHMNRIFRAGLPFLPPLIGNTEVTDGMLTNNRIIILKNTFHKTIKGNHEEQHELDNGKAQ